jgi:hypothetical protein
MKKFFYMIVISFLFVGLNYNADAQFLKKLGKKAEEAAKRATEKAVEKKVEEKTEKAVSGAIDEITDTENYKAESSDSQKEQGSTKPKTAEPSKPKVPVIESKPVSSSSKSVSSNAKNKKYPFERGIIYQQTSAMGIETNSSIYFDKWGDWTASETQQEMKVFGMSVKTHTREIVKGDEHWNLDFEKKTGTHFLQSVAINQLGIDVDAMTDDIMRNMKIEKIGEEEYLGYRCIKYKVTDDKHGINLTTLMHGNLTMWAEGEAMGIPTSTYITKIDLSAPPKNMFEVPSDIKITDISKK